MFGGAVIGGAAGYAGAAVYAYGMAAASSFSMGGFAAGFNAGMLSGLAAGAINGAGTSILNGGDLSDVMGCMATGAWFGGVIGGISGGFSEGISAMRDGRTFWTGEKWKTTADYSLPNGNLPLKRQPFDEFGCTQTTVESIAEYLGCPIELGLDDYMYGADVAQFANSHGFNTRTVANNEHFIGSRLTLGRPSAITYPPVPHTVGINSIQIQQVPRVIGSGFRTRTIIQVMDPLYSKYQNLPLSIFRKGLIRMF